MQFTTTVITLLAAVAMVEASCCPIITCGMRKRDLPVAAAALGRRIAPAPAAAAKPKAKATPHGDEFSHAFAKCLNKDHAQIKQQGNSFIIDGKATGTAQPFHDCTHLVAIYQKTGMAEGKLETVDADTFKFTPNPADLAEWTAGVQKAHQKRGALFYDDLY